MSSLTVYTPKITILDHAINMIDGLYSLKDFHKASGGDNKHAPFRFMRNAETKELIYEIERSPNMVNGNNGKAYKVVKGGVASEQGTYVCKELVYRYAMWVSPKFALIVIRTFDKLITGELKVVVDNDSLTAEQTLPLRNAVSKLVTKSGMLYPDVYKMVHQQFAVGHIKELTPEQIPQAVEYIHNLTVNGSAHSPMADFTHNQYIMEVNSKIMDYVHLLQRMIVAAGNTLPKYPDFDKEEICQAFIVSMIRHNRMMLSFNYQLKPVITFVPEEHAIVSSESISDVVQFADKSQLPNIINKAVERLGQ